MKGCKVKQQCLFLRWYSKWLFAEVYYTDDLKLVRDEVSKNSTFNPQTIISLLKLKACSAKPLSNSRLLETLLVRSLSKCKTSNFQSDKVIYYCKCKRIIPSLSNILSVSRSIKQYLRETYLQLHPIQVASSVSITPLRRFTNTKRKLVYGTISKQRTILDFQARENENSPF